VDVGGLLGDKVPVDGEALFGGGVELFDQVRLARHDDERFAEERAAVFAHWGPRLLPSQRDGPSTTCVSAVR